eukprot:CAMPEP_0204919664 /NCGR_PEP_ID=MMETSP1397-20131031/16944_1 /ASSEMBLY_ACC=CAM_ASM_000891 /TAXON_ID=49980 /ORGANISM="Climacostomum Climacostomum virens, Strain Stock W-24" /LENGTH=1951 /DNA_ID=CAMNT_0052093279 /DNA_START=152 /DNA_END=6003 /DNA_ORIENTATION=+
MLRDTEPGRKLTVGKLQYLEAKVKYLEAQQATLTSRSYEVVSRQADHHTRKVIQLEECLEVEKKRTSALLRILQELNIKDRSIFDGLSQVFLNVKHDIQQLNSERDPHIVEELIAFKNQLLSDNRVTSEIIDWLVRLYTRLIEQQYFKAHNDHGFSVVVQELNDLMYKSQSTALYFASRSRSSTQRLIEVLTKSVSLYREGCESWDFFRESVSVLIELEELKRVHAVGEPSDTSLKLRSLYDIVFIMQQAYTKLESFLSKTLMLTHSPLDMGVLIFSEGNTLNMCVSLLKELSDKLKVLASKVEMNFREHSILNSSLAIENEKLTNLINLKDAWITDLESSLTSAKEDVWRAEQAVLQVEEELNEEKRSKAEDRATIETLYMKIQSYDKETSNLKGLLKNTEAELKRSQNELQTSKLEVSTLWDAKQELDGKKDQLTAELETSKIENTQLKAKLAQLTFEHKALKDSNSEKERQLKSQFEITLNRNTQELNALKAKYESELKAEGSKVLLEQANNAKLKAQIGALEAEKVMLADELRSLKDEFDTFKLKLCDTEKALEKATSSRAGIEKEFDEMKQRHELEVQELNAELVDNKAKLKAAESQLASVAQPASPKTSTEEVKEDLSTDSAHAKASGVTLLKQALLDLQEVELEDLPSAMSEEDSTYAVFLNAIEALDEVLQALRAHADRRASLKAPDDTELKGEEAIGHKIGPMLNTGKTGNEDSDFEGELKITESNTSNEHTLQLEAQDFERQQEIGSYKEQIDELKQQVGSYESRNEECSSEIEMLRNEQTKLQSSLRDRDKELQAKQDEINELKASILEANCQKKKLQAESEKLANELRSSEPCSHIETLEKNRLEIERLTTELSLSQKEYESFQTTHDAVSARANELEEMLRAKEKELSEASSLITQQTSKISELESFETVEEITVQEQVTLKKVPKALVRGVTNCKQILEQFIPSISNYELRNRLTEELECIHIDQQTQKNEVGDFIEKLSDVLLMTLQALTEKTEQTLTESTDQKAGKKKKRDDSQDLISLRTQVDELMKTLAESEQKHEEQLKLYKESEQNRQELLKYKQDTEQEFEEQSKLLAETQKSLEEQQSLKAQVEDKLEEQAGLHLKAKVELTEQEKLYKEAEVKLGEHIKLLTEIKITLEEQVNQSKATEQRLVVQENLNKQAEQRLAEQSTLCKEAELKLEEQAKLRREMEDKLSELKKHFSEVQLNLEEATRLHKEAEQRVEEQAKLLKEREAGQDTESYSLTPSKNYDLDTSNYSETSFSEIDWSKRAKELEMQVAALQVSEAQKNDKIRTLEDDLEGLAAKLQIAMKATSNKSLTQRKDSSGQDRESVLFKFKMRLETKYSENVSESFRMIKNIWKNTDANSSTLMSTSVDASYTDLRLDDPIEEQTLITRTVKKTVKRGGTVTPASKYEQITSTALGGLGITTPKVSEIRVEEEVTQSNPDNPAIAASSLDPSIRHVKALDAHSQIEEESEDELSDKMSFREGSVSSVGSFDPSPFLTENTDEDLSKEENQIDESKINPTIPTTNIAQITFESKTPSRTERSEEEGQERINEERLESTTQEEGENPNTEIEQRINETDNKGTETITNQESTATHEEHKASVADTLSSGEVDSEGGSETKDKGTEEIDSSKLPDEEEIKAEDSKSASVAEAGADVEGAGENVPSKLHDEEAKAEDSKSASEADAGADVQGAGENDQSKVHDEENKAEEENDQSKLHDEEAKAEDSKSASEADAGADVQGAGENDQSKLHDEETKAEDSKSASEADAGADVEGAGENDQSKLHDEETKAEDSKSASVADAGADVEGAGENDQSKVHDEEIKAEDSKSASVAEAGADVEGAEENDQSKLHEEEARAEDSKSASEADTGANVQGAGENVPSRLLDEEAKVEDSKSASLAEAGADVEGAEENDQSKLHDEEAKAEDSKSASEADAGADV